MIAPPMIQCTFVFTRLLGASSGAMGNLGVRPLGHRPPTPRAVGPVGGERALALLAASLAGHRCPAISTRRAAASLLRLGLIDALLELLETRPKRSSERSEERRVGKDGRAW